MNKRAYISGKISGLMPNEVIENFKRASKKVEELGYTPVDPTFLNVYDLSYEEYMRIDFILIESCDAIYMMKNWKNSLGAIRERKHAKSLGKEIIYER